MWRSTEDLYVVAPVKILENSDLGRGWRKAPVQKHQASSLSYFVLHLAVVLGAIIRSPLYISAVRVHPSQISKVNGRLPELSTSSKM